ncbi:hypothetical protein KMI_11g16790 [Encephalitozoon hellem]|nr:hypothetical protein KMI_11g16790 [Encephalitozoon hellem]
MKEFKTAHIIFDDENVNKDDKNNLEILTTRLPGLLINVIGENTKKWESMSGGGSVVIYSLNCSPKEQLKEISIS